MLGPSDSRDLGKYLGLAQAGMEMVAPIGVGWLVDYYLDCSPWGVVGGAVLGLVGGLWHLVVMANRLNEKEESPKRRIEP